MSGDTATELVSRVVTGDRSAGSVVLSRIEAAEDGAGRAPWLDALAGAAATSSEALTVLLSAVDGCRLTDAPIRRLVVDPTEVDEIRQDVLIALTRSVSGFRGESRFETWLSAMARNVTIDAIRRRRDAASLDEARHRSAGARMSSMIATRESLRTAIDALDDRYRMPVVLRDVEGLSYLEIAERLELTMNTVKSRIFRARALLAAEIELEPNG